MNVDAILVPLNFSFLNASAIEIIFMKQGRILWHKSWQWLVEAAKVQRTITGHSDFSVIANVALVVIGMILSRPLQKFHQNCRDLEIFA